MRARARLTASPLPPQDRLSDTASALEEMRKYESQMAIKIQSAVRMGAAVRAAKLARVYMIKLQVADRV